MTADILQIGIGIICIVIAIVQTVRLRNIRKIRDTHLRLIWQNAKDLSHVLINEPEEKQPRNLCGARAQRIEESIAALIVNLSHVNRKQVEEWYRNNDIDDYDYKILKKLTL